MVSIKDLDLVDRKKLPDHIAIIMDGNGRWAQKRGLPRIAGHWAGAENLRNIVEFCSELNIKVLTVYAFSTENWRRPQDEVKSILNLLVYYLKKEVDNLNRNNIKLMMTGEWQELPPRVRAEIEKSIELTSNNTGLILNVALNYGSRREIVRACKDICQMVASGQLNPGDIDEKLFEKHLFTAGLPDPDLLIRPSGELRLSNFLLWQIAYSELWFCDTYWPDFKREDLINAILDYQRRERRFGGLTK
ncbi:isoprenyl transferase [Thermosediminibacter litoriperuensis]|uniref:Isoprenyl transferase n=1 Tax=Thermosediminibacter litoriperuensis TaxID=291989 RepID=A0A5S5ARX5_9FIRM|nr:isoprenyl transferase [Thermosediminibacter litoriperuensis]TYP54278.1 Undecaprenyl pyrophosphate synthetase [Thermosediminibacter litoriperuensis]